VLYLDFFELFKASMPAFLTGIMMTLRIISLGIIIGLIIGLVMGMLNSGNNKALKVIPKVYVDLVRGTPILVQD